MKYAVIAPPHILDMIEYQATFHMALGQWLVWHGKYKEWYIKRIRAGDFVMVDNGAAEPEDERVRFDLIVDACRQIRADEIVLPDVLRDKEATIEATVSNAVHVAPPNRVIVPQGSTIDEWVECLKILDDKLEGKYATIGIPKHLELCEGGRIAALNKAPLNILDEHHIHLFGVLENPHREISNALKAYPWIRSIDTGAAIAWAQNGRWIGEETVHYSLDNWKPADRAMTALNIDTIHMWGYDERD